jgi:arsenite-transporting ATPase
MLDAVMVNKILPRRADLGPYFDYWVSLQRGYLTEIDGSFSPTPIFRTVLQEGEPIGVVALEAIARATFGETDPGGLLFDERPIWLDQWNDEGKPGVFDLCLRLPFLDDGETVDLTRNGTDLTITVGRLQRTIALPRILYDCTLGHYRYEDGVLRLEFFEAPGDGQSERTPGPADTMRVEAA